MNTHMELAVSLHKLVLSLFAMFCSMIELWTLGKVFNFFFIGGLRLDAILGSEELYS